MAEPAALGADEEGAGDNVESIWAPRLLKHYAVIVGKNKIWCSLTKTEMGRTALVTLVGDRKTVDAWLARPDKRTISASDVAAQKGEKEQQAKDGNPVFSDSLARYVYLDGSDSIWDNKLRKTISNSALKLALGDWYKGWLNDPRRRVLPLENLVFDPTQRVDQDTHINLFRGLPMTAAFPPGLESYSNAFEALPSFKQCEGILDLMMWLCNNRIEVMNWLLCWLAYLSDNFAIARQAGVLLVEVFERITSVGQLAVDALAAPFTDDTVAAAMDRHAKRLAEISQITSELYAEAERGSPAQLAAAQAATAAVDAQAEAQRDVAAAAGQAGAAVEQAGTAATEGQQKAVDKVEELILKLDAIPEAMRKSGEAGRAQIQATLGDALQQLSDVDLTRLAERSRAAFGAMSQVTREVAGEALRRLGLDADQALDGISQETAQAISAQDALGAAGVRSGTAISQALDAALSKADGAKSIDQLRERINAFGRQGVLSADQVRDRLTELEIKAAELAAGTDAVAAAFARMGVKSKAELAALAAQAAADFDKINQSGQAAPEGLLAAAQRYLEATQAAGDEAGTALAQAQVRAAEVRLELMGLKPVADAAGDAGESAGNRTAAAMDAAAGSAADARAELESVGSSAAGIAQAMGAFQEGLREDLGQLSLAASEAFAARQGLPASAAAASESMDDLSEAVRDANAELGALQVSTLITGNEFSRWFGTAEANAAAVRAQFLEQRLEAERLAESYAQMDISLGTQIPTLDALRERFGLLDDSQLEGLNRSLDAANQKLARLTQAAQDARNELDSINADLQDELDRSAGNQEAILNRKYEQDRARIDALVAQAGADQQAKQAAEQALNRLQQKYQQDLAAARKEAEPAPAGGGGGADGRASGAGDGGALVSRTERLIVELPGGVSRSLDVAPGQLGVATDLLRTLAAAKSVSLGA